jgi:integrase
MRCKLSNKKIQQLQSKGKPYKISDGGGLILHVSAKGGKVWRYVFRFKGKQRTLTIGQYPGISLRKARELHEDARKDLRCGVNPADKKRAHSQQVFREEAQAKFEVMARRFLENHSKCVKDETLLSLNRILERRLLPFLGDKDIRNVGAVELSGVIERISKEGFDYAAKKALALCGQIFRFAMTKGWGDRGLKDITAALRAAAPPIKGLAFLKDPQKLGGLLRKIDACQGQNKQAAAALRLAPLVFLRPAELVSGEWEDVSFKDKTWVIPRHKMKMKREHTVPLSRQALQILADLKKVNGGSRYIFPSPYGHEKHIEKHSLTHSLRALGYTAEEHTVHGFRKTASTLLNEMGFNSDWIERQLSHSSPDKVRGVYNKAEYMEGRRKMMQEWADYLDKLKKRAKQRRTGS